MCLNQSRRIDSSLLGKGNGVFKREAVLIKSLRGSGDNTDTRFAWSLETVRRWRRGGGQLEPRSPKVSARGLHWGLAVAGGGGG